MRGKLFRRSFVFYVFYFAPEFCLLTYVSLSTTVRQGLATWVVRPPLMNSPELSWTRWRLCRFRDTTQRFAAAIMMMRGGSVQVSQEGLSPEGLTCWPPGGTLLYPVLSCDSEHKLERPADNLIERMCKTIFHLFHNYKSYISMHFYHSCLSFMTGFV